MISKNLPDVFCSEAVFRSVHFFVRQFEQSGTQAGSPMSLASLAGKQSETWALLCRPRVSRSCRLLAPCLAMLASQTRHCRVRR